MDQSIETPLGRYRLLALLGQGGMADVYLACTKGPGGFQKLLVVKLARFTGDPIFSTMFLDEARIAAQLEHPNIVQTYEVGEETSRHYIVMEYLDGANFARLRQRAKKVGGIPLRISIQILHQVLEGLAYAHEARGIDGKLLRVVHRDLTPSNIIVTNQGVVKILDFGIAKAVDTQSFTQTGRYSGKLSYMPPEQLRVESVDGRADIFSVGVILAEAALGERFWGNASGQVIAQQLGAGQLPSLDGVPDLDPELRRICGRALAPDREQRYPNASIFKADLLRYLNTLGGPLSREELGDFVCEIVADDRAKLKATIDTQLARISQQSIPIPIPRAMTDLPVIEMTPSDKRSVHTEPTSIRRDATYKDDDVLIERIDQPASPAPAAPPVASRRVGLIAGIAGGVVLAGVLVFALTRGSKQPLPPASARLEVIVSPPDAVLKLDGKPLDMNPYAGSLPRDEQVHELVVTAAGFEPQTRKFTLDRDLMLQLRLEKVAAPPAPPVAAAPPAPSTPAHEPAVATTPVAPVERPATKATPPRTVAATKAPHPAAVAHSPTRTAPATTPPAATVATTPPAATTPTTTTPPAVTTTQPATTASGKRAIDADVFDKKTGTTKRAIDSNVFDSDKTTKKPTIDRDNPWKK